MTKNQHQHRKDEHLSLAMKQWKQGLEPARGISFEDVRLVPNFLADASLGEINLRPAELFADELEFPFYIEAMTGGSERGDKLNEQLALIAKNQHLAMAVGSQSIALKYPELAAGFRRVRELNPDGFILANLGANHGLEDAKIAVDMLKANALELHVNMAQELVMAEGDRSFNFIENIHEISENLDIPVIVKEVGFGMSKKMFMQLSALPIEAVNVGGRGGTNFSVIEGARNHENFSLDLDAFGYSTVESLLNGQDFNLPMIATGGIQSAEDLVKSQIIGARLASSAGYFLKELVDNGADSLEATIEAWKLQMKQLYLLLGVTNSEELKDVEVLIG